VSVSVAIMLSRLGIVCAGKGAQRPGLDSRACPRECGARVPRAVMWRPVLTRRTPLPHLTTRRHPVPSCTSTLCLPSRIPSLAAWTVSHRARAEHHPLGARLAARRDLAGLGGGFSYKRRRDQGGYNRTPPPSPLKDPWGWLKASANAITSPFTSSTRSQAGADSPGKGKGGGHPGDDDVSIQHARMMRDKSEKMVMLALGGNLVITTAKLVAWVNSGSR
jgi:hypothetical protein